MLGKPFQRIYIFSWRGRLRSSLLIFHANWSASFDDTRFANNDIQLGIIASYFTTMQRGLPGVTRAPGEIRTIASFYLFEKLQPINEETCQKLCK